MRGYGQATSEWLLSSANVPDQVVGSSLKGLTTYVSLKGKMGIKLWEGTTPEPPHFLRSIAQKLP